MTIALRILLCLSSLIVTSYVLRKIRKTQMKIEDSIFWICISLFIVLLSVVPQIVYYLTSILGIVSPVNFVFLFFIFILLVKSFSLSIKQSQLEERIKVLTQIITIKENYSQDTVEKDEKSGE